MKKAGTCQYRFLNSTLLLGGRNWTFGEMAWGDKIVVAIAVLCFVLIVVALVLSYSAIRATITL